MMIQSKHVINYPKDDDTGDFFFGKFKVSYSVELAV
jgi:hypothetical protein